MIVLRRHRFCPTCASHCNLGQARATLPTGGSPWIRVRLSCKSIHRRKCMCTQGLVRLDRPPMTSPEPDLCQPASHSECSQPKSCNESISAVYDPIDLAVSHSRDLMETIGFSSFVLGLPSFLTSENPLEHLFARR